MKLSVIPTWTCSGPTGCHWCHQVPPAVPWSLTEWVCALKHPVPSWQGPCTHTLGFWCHHFAEDVEDSPDDAEDPRDGLEALVDVGEAHEVLESLMKTMMPLQRSWSPLIWWHDGTLMKSLMHWLVLVLALDPLVSFVEKVMEPLHVLWWWWPYMVSGMWWMPLAWGGSPCIDKINGLLDKTLEDALMKHCSDLEDVGFK